MIPPRDGPHKSGTGEGRKKEEKMNKIQKQAVKIQEKIKGITKAAGPIAASFSVDDDSVQAELRLSAGWKIWMRTDIINYPCDLGGQHRDLWRQMSNLSYEIAQIANLSAKRLPGEKYKPAIIKINERTKEGPTKRAEAKAAWVIDAGKQFLADYRRVTGKKHLAEIRKQIIALQAQQKALLPELRAANSAVVLGRKTAKQERMAKNAEALKTGRFWEADHETLKGYFHPPFEKNYVADVSEKWRACLILECQSVSFKLYSGDWGHKLAGTGRGYLCGIDDNGDEWGFTVHGLPQSYDNYGNAALDSTVEEAMANVFGVTTKQIPECIRQGDLLFHPEQIPGEHTICERCGYPYHADYKELGRAYPCGCYYGEAQPKTIPAVELHAESVWEPRESHVITSQGMERNGTYFRSAVDIIVTHTSHPRAILPPGEYRLYMSHAADPVD